MGSSESSETVRVGVLSFHNSKETKAILNAVDDLGHEPVWLRQNNLSVTMDGESIAVKPDVDVIANRLLLSTATDPSNLLGVAATLEDAAPLLNKAASTLISAYKPASYASLSAENVPIPDTALALSAENLNAEAATFGGDWFIQKPAIGAHGDGTRRVRHGTSVSSRLGRTHSLVQEMIAQDADERADIRIYVVDGEVIGGMRRVAPDDEWRTNVAQGAVPTEADLTPSMKETAIRATEAVGLDCAGVDIIEGDERMYVLEVNPTAGFRGFFKATGISPAPYIAAAALERTDGVARVSDEKIAEIATTLDDSYPTSDPSYERPEETATIDFVEAVRVSGKHTTTTVEGKADTGARQSIIDTALAAELGAGPVEDTKEIRVPSHGRQQTMPIVPLTVGIGDREYHINAVLQDRGEMTHKFVLGRDILQHYTVSLDAHL